MNTDQADIDLIERHLSGQLTHAEAVDFEERLGEDHEFARKLRLRKAFPSLFNAAGDDIIAQAVVEVPEVRIKKKKVYLLKPRHFVWAIIVLLAGILFYFLFIRISRPMQKTREKKPVARVVEKAVAKTQQPEKAGSPEQAISLHKSIVLESPADGMGVNRAEDIVFRWKQSTDSFTNFYLFSEASNKLAWWRGIRPGIRELTIPANKLNTGRFYWYVGTKESKRILIINP
ncbi:MAG: hypothetical protein NTY96_09005 [Bacteroidetes bacterium]|nr:hypothetical protein [Bacteroidota bacterium]